ncbi:nitrite reductase small subunit NirD [Coraliomargarita akajimensis]|uniref:Nitrite reductase (NAD(P)H), small subunit n=1 Tax=Coraliomargarita akajimensis (strain DSM 45221 / IAM 15411 / JCM 23193 / KCTC 12865 / 04OKA010-24) TaxID=583355 RepID=D5EJ46_CORAD|nr:nitrite reductase small subunit NirD [Coraliomargarita akajimensis]ADE54445.1 nitrite reductase (NAD(P)H), small subunit [Coraliomargarita akajimensis DSM 45221]
MTDTLKASDWIEVGLEVDFPEGLGICIQYGEEQIAVYNFNGTEWYAVQNRCPHENQMVLSRGLTGTVDGEPKIACPLHKRAFSLRTGEFLGEGEMSCLSTYPVKCEEGKVYLQV